MLYRRMPDWDDLIEFRRNGGVKDPVVPIHSPNRRPIGNPRTNTYSQRATMKMTYAKTSSTRLSNYVAYITRAKAGENEARPTLYSARENDVEPTEAYKTRKHEQIFFRVMLSPERGHEMDMTEYTRSVMQRWEKATEQPLVWYAANHYNTETPHSHVLIRGVDRRGNQVRFDPRFVKRNGREFAMEAATAKLGLRTRKDLERDLSAQVRARRMTSLDYQLLRRQRSHSEDLVAPRTMYEERRVRHLAKLGLAKEGVRPNSWKMAKDWTAALSEMGKHTDRVKRMNKAVDGREKPHMVWDSSVGKITGFIRDHEYEDESAQVKYAVIETKDRVYYLYGDDERRVDPKAKVGDQVVVNPRPRISSAPGSSDDERDARGVSLDRSREQSRGR